MGKIVALLDILALFAASSVAKCLGDNKSLSCQQAVNSGPTWIIISIAILVTLFYFYRRQQQHLSLMPINFLEKTNLPWSYWIYMFLALIFFGENLPELAGYAQGLPLGAPGTHASLMEPALFFAPNSDTLSTLFAFAGITLVITFLLKTFNFLIGAILSVSLGTTVEFITHIGEKPGNPEGFDFTNNLFGSTLTLVWLWSLLVLIPYFIFILIQKFWGNRGIIFLISFLILLNIGSYFFFKYERDVLKNVLPGYLDTQKDFLTTGTCPDQIRVDNGKYIFYKDGVELTVKNQSDINWILNNCPNAQTAR